MGSGNDDFVNTKNQQTVLALWFKQIYQIIEGFDFNQTAFQTP